MTEFEIRKQALEREEARQNQMNTVLANKPKRGSAELSKVIRAIHAAHALLCVLDLSADPPALGGATQTWFDTAIARAEELLKKSED